MTWCLECPCAVCARTVCVDACLLRCRHVRHVWHVPCRMACACRALRHARANRPACTPHVRTYVRARAHSHLQEEEARERQAEGYDEDFEQVHVRARVRVFGRIFDMRAPMSVCVRYVACAIW